MREVGGQVRNREVFRPPLWQCESEDVAASGDSDKLFRINRISHRGRADVLPGIEVPQRFSGGRVHSFERLRVIAKKHQSAGSRHDASR